jgi:hypothetical protein
MPSETQPEPTGSPLPEELSSESERTVQARHSALRIDVTLSVGYTRERPGISDHWEMRVSTIGLMIAGALVTLVILAVLLPHILSLLSGL